MDYCLTYLEFNSLIETIQPLYLLAVFFGGYGLISLFLEFCVYLDRVLFRYFESRPYSNTDQDLLPEKDRGHK